jgi:transposase InsO family protein
MYRGQQTYLVRERPKFKPKPDRKPRRWPTANPDGDFRGVHRGKRNWRAVINHQGKRYHLGYFTTEEKAIAARLAAEEAIKRGEIPAH